MIKFKFFTLTFYRLKMVINPKNNTINKKTFAEKNKIDLDVNNNKQNIVTIYNMIDLTMQ